ncbi:MAG: hypothetical protein AB8B53_13830 [Flavobacteriales bacterium]
MRSNGDSIDWKTDFSTDQKVKFWDYVGKQNYGDTLIFRLPDENTQKFE